ncbi:hypothetical protein TNCV_2705051 [Trichonephila clavipes]|nr:hypothetical protein TNCV_2705051 [Trichonephila clavipes]
MRRSVANNPLVAEQCDFDEHSLATEDPLCRDGRCTVNLSRLIRPPVGVVWKLGERGVGSGVVLVNCDYGSKLLFVELQILPFVWCGYLCRVVIQSNRVYKISVQLNALKREKKTFLSFDTSRQKGR